MSRQRITACLLIVVEATALGIHTRMMTFSAVAIAAALYGLFTRKQVEWTKDQKFVVFVALSILFVVKYIVAPHQLRLNALFIGTAQTMLLGQFLIVLQVGQFFLYRREERLPLWFPAVGAAAMIFVSNVRVNSDERLIAQILTLLYIALAAVYFGASRRVIRGMVPVAARSRTVAGMAVLVVACGLGWSAASALLTFERDIERWITSFVFRFGRSQSSAGFSRTAQLGSLSRAQDGSEDLVALRVSSSSNRPPGYLRGMVFDEFSEGQWHRSTVSGSKAIRPMKYPPQGILQHAEQTNIFRVRIPPGVAWNRFEMWPDPSLESLLFHREDMTHFETSVESIRVTGHGTAEADQLPPGQPYAAFAPAEPGTTELVYEPRPPESYTSPLFEPDPRLRPLADEVFAGCETTSEKLRAVSRFFRSNFLYDRGINPPPYVENPITWFILERPPAHCEYFASATVMLLRMERIPCRYVTGFVVTEFNNYSGHWLARNKDAHAWAEAYDPERGWVIVESTPTVGIPTAFPPGAPGQLIESLRLALLRLRYRLQQDGLPWLAEQLMHFLLRPVGIVTAGVLVTFIAIRVRRHWLAARRSAAARDPLVRELQRLLLRMDRHVRQYELKRHPGETLHQFAVRVAEADASLPISTTVADWYRRYAAVRYRRHVDPKTLSELAAAIPR